MLDMKRQLAVMLLGLSLVCFAPCAVGGQSQSVEGTVWEGMVKLPDADGKVQEHPYVFEFLPNHRLPPAGTWQQTGNNIRMEVNGGASTWIGTIEEGRMSGTAENRLGHKWNWELIPRSKSNATTAKWTIYSSVAGRFSMSFPGQPTLKEQQFDSAAGKLTINLLTASAGPSTFLASYVDYPPITEDLQAVLDRVRDGAVGSAKATLIKSTAITLKGYPGREFLTSGEGIVATFRIYLVNNRLYQIGALGPPDASTEEAKAFLNSFDLKVDK
jgi:hypothetical protein